MVSKQAFNAFIVIYDTDYVRSCFKDLLTCPIIMTTPHALWIT
jgi:hypothetical protein